MNRTSSCRCVQAEWLDTLPAGDPLAVRSRQDLRRINALVMQARVMVRLLRTAGLDQPRTVLELGGGAGTLMLSVARRLAPQWPGVAVRVLDRHLVSAHTRSRFAALGWTVETMRQDVLVALANPDRLKADLVVANLFLHHFDQYALTTLLRHLAATTALVVACEPERSPLALAGCHLLRGFGCNDVTRHDTRFSVEAGFTGREMSDLWSTAVGPRARWALDERLHALLTHTFVARRVEAGA